MVEGLTLQLRGGRTQSGVQPKFFFFHRILWSAQESSATGSTNRSGCMNNSLAGPNPLVPSATAGVKLRGRNAYGETAAASSGVPPER